MSTGAFKSNCTMVFAVDTVILVLCMALNSITGNRLLADTYSDAYRYYGAHPIHILSTIEDQRSGAKTGRLVL